MSILQHADIEREIEYGDEGDPREPVTPTYCADCGDEEVDEVGKVCDVCVADPRPEILPSHLYTEIMGVCGKVLEPTNQNLVNWDVLACVRDVAQLAMAAKKEAA